MYSFIDGFIKNNKLKFEMSKPSFKGELDELVGDKTGIYKKKSSTMKYYIVGLEFKRYCEQKKYNLFDDEEVEQESKSVKEKKKIPYMFDDKIELEEDNPLEYGINKIELAIIPDEKDLKIKKQNDEIEALKKMIEELKKPKGEDIPKVEVQKLEDKPQVEVQKPKSKDKTKIVVPGKTKKVIKSQTDTILSLFDI